MIRKFGPAVVAIVFAVLTAAAAALTDGRIDPGEGVQLAIQGTTVAGVWLVPAIPSWPHAKTAIAALLAALNLLTTVITDGLTVPEVVNLAVAFAGVFAMRFTPQPVHQGAQAEPTVVRW